MRIALISMTELPATDVRVAGHPLAWHQLQAALDLSCERVIVLADAPGPALAIVQREAERRGATFHAVAGHRPLSGLVSAADTLVVFAPGVLPDRDWLVQAFGARAGIATLPADSAIEQGFERIDRERAWAGVLATRGDAVEALAGLAPDADPIGGLLRVSLQRAGGTLAVPDKWIDDGRWAMVTSEGAAQRYQDDWYARHVPAPSLSRPGAALAYKLARRLLDRLGDAQRSSIMLAGSGSVMAVGGALAGYLGWTAAGLGALTIGSMLLSSGSALARLAGAGSPAVERPWMSHARRALLDLSLVAIASSPAAFENWWTAFAALMLVGAIRLSLEEGAPRLLRPMSDRPFVFLVLTMVAAVGVLPGGLAILALIALAVRIFAPRQRS